MALRFQEVSDLILYEMYWLAAQPNSIEDIAPYDLPLAMDGRTSDSFFRIAIEKLATDGFIEKIGVMPDTFGITARGIEHVEKNLNDLESFLWDEHQRRRSDERGWAPAANRYVDLDHNSAEYREAVEAGEAVIEALRASNTYAEQDPADRDQRLGELEAGYRLIKAARVNPTTVKMILGGVLAYLATKFADEPIGELAKVAWSTLKQLLGIQ